MHSWLWLVFRHCCCLNVTHVELHLATALAAGAGGSDVAGGRWPVRGQGFRKVWEEWESASSLMTANQTPLIICWLAVKIGREKSGLRTINLCLFSNFLSQMSQPSSRSSLYFLFFWVYLVWLAEALVMTLMLHKGASVLIYLTSDGSGTLNKYLCTVLFCLFSISLLWLSSTDQCLPVAQQVSGSDRQEDVGGAPAEGWRSQNHLSQSSGAPSSRGRHCSSTDSSLYFLCFLMCKE